MGEQREIKPYGWKDLARLIQRRWELEGESGCHFDSHYILELFEELRQVLETNDPHPWEKKEEEEVVGEVWEQYLGTVYFRHSKHVFTCLYVENEGLAIDRHGNNEVMPNGDIRKVRERYIYPDGRVSFCGKNDTHRLVNSFNHPIYVISVKMSSAERYRCRNNK